MYNGLVEIKGRIQLPKHRHLMAFETSCLVYSCCGLWISHKLCHCCQLIPRICPAYKIKAVCLQKDLSIQSHQNGSAHLRMKLCTVPYADCLGTKEIHHNGLFLPNSIALLTLTGNCVFICSAPLCLTESKTFWGLNVQKVSVY